MTGPLGRGPFGVPANPSLKCARGAYDTPHMRRSPQATRGPAAHEGAPASAEASALSSEARRIEDLLRGSLGHRPWVASIGVALAPDALPSSPEPHHSRVRRRIPCEAGVIWIELAWDDAGENRDDLVSSALALAEASLLRAEAERERDAMAARFASVQERMRERSSLASLGTMATSVAHDIRSPLWALLANTEYLTTALRGWIPEDQENIWAAVQENRLAIEVIEGVLSSISTFVRDRPVPELVDITLAIDAAVHVTRWHFDRAGVEIDTSAVERPRGRATVSELTQALVSLLSNAAEASPRGAVVRVVARDELDAAVIYVSDEGPGVPADLAERIFEPFHTSKATGLGLGLSVARELVHGFRGQLGLRLDPPSDIPTGRGACFEVRLPSR